MNAIFKLFFILILFGGAAAQAQSSCSLQQYARYFPPIQPALYLDGAALAETLLAQSGQKMQFRKFAWGLNLPYVLASSLPIAYPQKDLDEKKLQDWIAQQPEFSIQLSAFFDRALEIAGFDVARALALSWNTLRDNCKSFGIERNLRENTLKLADITGELILLNPISQDKTSYNSKPMTDARGDNYSAWYHFFGTAIYGFARATTMPGLPPIEWILKLEHSTYAAHVIYKEKRGNIEKAGARFGRLLARSFINPLQSHLARPYLYDNTQIYDEHYITRREQMTGEPRNSLMQRALLARLLFSSPNLFTAEDWNCFKSQLMQESEPSLKTYVSTKLGVVTYPVPVMTSAR